RFPLRGGSEIELFLPVWTPGSYLIREYARNLEEVRADAGAVFKTAKNRWKISMAGGGEAVVRYRVYCREMSVRTNWVEESFALLNGAATFLNAAGDRGMAYEVTLELPATWTLSACGLDEIGEHRYFARDYDALVDSPLYAGTAPVYRFEIGGVPHDLVNHGGDGVWDGSRSAADVETIVRRHIAMWGDVPYSKYVFLNLMTEARGGLEHRNSMCVMTSRWATGAEKSYRNWLGLISHEFFHVWNVKRLRPVELGPFDYEAENPTAGLWFAEGITEYYAHLLVRRAGLITRTEYLAELSQAIHSLQTTPGRGVTSVEQASRDAWIKLYRPDENTPNTSISYYVKGAVIGWLLDTRIRAASGGSRSLDDLMRQAYARYSGGRGFTGAEMRGLASEVAGESLEGFFGRTLESTEELDYAEALQWFGLRFRPTERTGQATMGAETKIEGGRLVVARIPRGTLAYDSGLNVGDEIVAIEGFRVRPEGLAERMGNYQPGDRVVVLIARREKLREIEVSLGEDPGDPWRLEISPEASTDQRRCLEVWLE
ncbi:MAG: M61 family metallopeptidase, partial [Acidobacteriota bacterium]|nr:M61 family metallopeptidase [Acidobacteriota bacterium]